MGELKPGWKRMKFGEIAQCVNDRVDDPSKAGVDRYVGLEHLDPESLTIRRWGVPTDVESNKLRFRAGDIIFGKRRAYQRKLAVADFEGICSAHAMVLRAKPSAVRPEFLPFFMQSDLFMQRAIAISVGSLSPTINWVTLAAEQFSLPSIEEQRRITEVLQAARVLGERHRELSDSVAQARLALVFEFESHIPDDGMTTLGEVTRGLQAGKSPASSGREAADDECGVLKVSAVGDWEYMANENKAIAADDFIHDLEVKAGDFLVTRANADPDSVGRTCIVKSTRSKLMISDKTWKLLLHDGSQCDPHAVLAWTKSRSFRRHIRNHLNGTDAKNISQSSFLACPIPRFDASFRLFGERISLLNRSVGLVSARADHARKFGRRLLAEVLDQ